MTRPIPTVQASPELLRAGDIIHPDLPIFDATATITVTGPAEAVRDPDGALVAWKVPLGPVCWLAVPADAKVETQRRPMPQPRPRVKSEEDWEPDTVQRRVPARTAQ